MRPTHEQRQTVVNLAMGVFGVILLFGTVLLFAGADMQATGESYSSWRDPTAVKSLVGGAVCLVVGLASIVAAMLRGGRSLGAEQRQRDLGSDG